MKQIAYVDGACLGNPGPGGWGLYLQLDSGEVEMSGREDPSTNNRMELTAAIMGIEKASQNDPLTVVTDSKYVQQGITTWIHGWKRKGWKTMGGDPVKNQDLWQRLDSAVARHGKVEWKWVKGHNGDFGNERADKLATSAAKGLSLDFPPAVLAAIAPAAAPKTNPETVSEELFDTHTVSCDFGFEVEPLHVYDLPPLDFNWGLLRSVDETRLEIEVKARLSTGDAFAAEKAFEAVGRFMAFWDRAQQAARERGWEGDFRHRPFVFWVPDTFRLGMRAAFVFKQDNNGSTFVVSPIPLPHLKGGI